MWRLNKPNPKLTTKASWWFIFMLKTNHPRTLDYHHDVRHTAHKFKTNLHVPLRDIAIYREWRFRHVPKKPTSNFWRQQLYNAVDIHTKLIDNFSHASDVTFLKAPFYLLIVFHLNMKRHPLKIQMLTFAIFSTL